MVREEPVAFCDGVLGRCESQRVHSPTRAVKKMLHDRSGGGEDNIVQTFTLSATEVGDANGRWQLKVVDTAAADTGTVNSVKLSFQ